MSEVFLRHRVNVVNISIRHALADPGSFLAWAREEVFAFVVYYKQSTDPVEKNRVAVWTRELIDATILVGGSYYLPYQAHATPEQFHKAYPNAKTLFDLKTRLDPQFRLRNVIWNTYYQPTRRPTMKASSEFKTVFSDTKNAGWILPVPPGRLPSVPRGQVSRAHRGSLRVQIISDQENLH